MKIPLPQSLNNMIAYWYNRKRINVDTTRRVSAISKCNDSVMVKYDTGIAGNDVIVYSPQSVIAATKAKRRFWYMHLHICDPKQF